MYDAFLFVDSAHKGLLHRNEQFFFVGRFNYKKHIDCTIVDGYYFTQHAVGYVVDGVAYKVVVGSLFLLILDVVALGVEYL